MPLKAQTTSRCHCDLSDSTENRYMANYANRAALKHPKDGSFTGCIFNHAASEFYTLSHPIYQAAVEHKPQLLDIFEEETEALGHPNPKALAQTLLILLDRAFASAQIMGDMGLFKQAHDATET